MAVPIPDSHRDLLAEPVHGVLSTMMPDGQPQSSIVWTDYDGAYVLINTTLERQKGRNMCSNPKVALLVIDPKDSSRWIEIRGNVVEISRGWCRSPCRQTHATLHRQTTLLWRHLPCRTKTKGNARHRQN